MSITLDDLRDIPSETLPNPNLPPRRPNGAKQVKHPSGGTKRSIDPAKEFNIPSQRELDKVDPAKQTLETKVLTEADGIIQQKMGEAIAMHELEEQLDGKVEYEDYVDAIGFDPLAMMENPPKPGKSKAIRDQEAANRAAYEREQEMKTQYEYDPVEEDIEEEYADSYDTTELHYSDSEEEEYGEYESDDIEYENDDIDPEEELDQMIQDAIPEEEEYDYIEEDEIDNEPVTPSFTITKEEEVVNKSDVMTPIPDDVSELMDRDEDADLKALDDDNIVEKGDSVQKRRLENLKREVQSKIKPITKGLNLASFKIIDKPINVTESVNRAATAFNVKTADWALPATGRSITMKAFKGSEVANLLKDPGRNKLRAAKEQYGLIHSHIIDEYKPETVDAWAKTVSVADVDHLYAAIYRASFEGENFLPYDCPDDKCANSFLTNSVPFMDMVKFKDDNVKARFDKAYNQPSTPSNRKMKLDVIPVSDSYAFAFKEPTIYDAVFTPAYLDDEFIAKYADTITFATCIDKVFFIDPQLEALRPLNVKQYPNDPAKSLKAKIIVLSKVMKELTSDQYQIIRLYVEKLTGAEQDITFVLPKTTCPKCGKEIEESTYSAAQLLFLRHHLAALANG